MKELEKDLTGISWQGETAPVVHETKKHHVTEFTRWFKCAGNLEKAIEKANEQGFSVYFSYKNSPTIVYNHN